MTNTNNDELSMQQCVACRKGAPTVSDTEAKELLQQVPEWRIFNRDGINKLERVFTFKNFVDALAFTNTIGALAEEQGHHPGLLTELGRVTVTWWSHKIKGLHRNDFIVAAKTDRLYKESVDN